MKECKIIQDLLPNYIDKLTSEETNKFVEEHLKNCEECKKILNDMQKEVVVDGEKIEEREVKYIKKFGNRFKILKITLMLITILIIAFAISTVREVIILSDIDKKISMLENNNNNIYVKSYSKSDSSTMQVEYFVKDDVYKTVLEVKFNDGRQEKQIEIIADTHKIYQETHGNKTLVEYNYSDIAPRPIKGYHIEFPEGAIVAKVYNAIPNFGYTTVLHQKIPKSIVTKIKEVEIDGKKYYEMHNLLNDEITKNEITYIEKDTGLIQKVIRTNNKNEETITTYEYQFNSVTDEDIAEPDETQYRKIN